MSTRIFYLADGTLQKATAGEFRGDDPEVSTQVVTREIVVRADDGAEDYSSIGLVICPSTAP